MPLGAERAVLLGSGSNTYAIEILIVAAGGGGGTDHRGGGGGGGGIVYDADYSTAPTIEYDLTIGSGGSANGIGNDSVWNVNAEGGGITFTADGGGGGRGMDGGCGSGYYG